MLPSSLQLKEVYMYIIDRKELFADCVMLGVLTIGMVMMALLIVDTNPVSYFWMLGYLTVGLMWWSVLGQVAPALRMLRHQRKNHEAYRQFIVARTALTSAFNDFFASQCEQKWVSSLGDGRWLHLSRTPLYFEYAVETQMDMPTSPDMEMRLWTIYRIPRDMEHAIHLYHYMEQAGGDAMNEPSRITKLIDALPDMMLMLDPARIVGPSRKDPVDMMRRISASELHELRDEVNKAA